VIDKNEAVISSANVITNKANSSQQMGYKVRSHDLGNLPWLLLHKESIAGCWISYNKEREHSIFKNKVHIILIQRDACHKTSYMRGVSYAILTLGNSCSVLPSLETFHSTTIHR
jgi:hypothetical protein